MKNKNYVSSLKELEVKLTRQPNIPNSLNPLLDRVMPPILRVLGAILGFGRKTAPAVRLPEYMMELSDGTKLATDIYLPKEVFVDSGKVKCPTILVRMPYWKDNFSFIGYAFALYGYAVVVQDIRGTGHSEGMNFILIPDRDDGLETLKWITKRFWYNGKIGMSGGSYFGMTQWCVSWDNDDMLQVICPCVSSYSNMMRLHGGMNINSLLIAFKRILINTTSHRDSPSSDTCTIEQMDATLDPRVSMFNDKINVVKPKLSNFEGLPVDFIVKFIKRMFKIKEMDLTKRNYEYFFVLLNRLLENIDVNHDKMFGMLELDVKKLNQPAYMVGGWYDMFLEHTLKDYLDIKANGAGISQEGTRIVIGPYAHAAVGGKTNKLDNGMITFLRQFIAKDQYEYWLKGIDNEEMHKPPIKYYVMGKDMWRYSDVWPPERVSEKKLYLHSKGKANSLNGNGSVGFEEPGDEPEDNFKFNPLNPVITKGGRNLDIAKGARDQRDNEQRNDVLVYTSEPLEKGIEMTGPIKIVLYASSSAKDTDFTVKLVDVYPKKVEFLRLLRFKKPREKALNILNGAIRARFRAGHDNPTLIEPGKIIKYEFLVGNTSNYFKPGHRIRVDISSSNFPKYDVNSNMGGEGEEGAYMIADQKIFHDKEHPTHLILPIYK